MIELRRKVLLIGSWAPPMIGGPQSLYNIFSNISTPQYAILTSYRTILTSLARGLRGCALPSRYFFVDSPEPDLKIIVTSPLTKTQERRPTLRRFVNTLHLLPVVREFFNAASYILLTYQFIRSFRRVANIFHPETLIGLTDQGPALMATAWLARRNHLPYLVYVFDLYRGNSLPQPQRLIAHLFERWIFSGARCVIVTNDGTADFYRQRYGNHITTSVVHNSRKQLDIVSNPQSSSSTFTIVFTGNIDWPQVQSVRNLMLAMDLLTDIPIVFKVYCPAPPQDIVGLARNKKNVQLLAANQSEIPSILTQANLLFLPLSWNSKAPQIIETASPGKFTEYMSSGRPMLIHAPEYAYVSRYARQHRLGLVVDTNNFSVLAASIRDFSNNPELGQKFASNALATFKAEYDAIGNAQKLADVLNSIR